MPAHEGSPSHRGDWSPTAAGWLLLYDWFTAAGVAVPTGPSAGLEMPLPPRSQTSRDISNGSRQIRSIAKARTCSNRASIFWVSIFRFCTFSPPLCPPGCVAGTIGENGHTPAAGLQSEKRANTSARRQQVDPIHKHAASASGSFLIAGCWLLVGGHAGCLEPRHPSRRRGVVSNCERAALGTWLTAEGDMHRRITAREEGMLRLAEGLPFAQPSASKLRKLGSARRCPPLSPLFPLPPRAGHPRCRPSRLSTVPFWPKHMRERLCC